MEKQLIRRINGIEIYAENLDGEVIIPIKPICTALGIAYQSQHEKLKTDEFFGSVITENVTTGADGKQYEMTCLPLMYAMLWLGSINPSKVNPEAKEAVMKYKLECAKAIHFHFYGKMKRMNELTSEENRLLREKDEACELKKEAENKLRTIKSRLDDIALERRNIQPSLFD